MACIGCGLGVNADGKGRVAIDTVGGLECNGTAGGQTNTPGNGIRIKLNPEKDNVAKVDADGLYVPPVPDNFEIYDIHLIEPKNLTGSGTNPAYTPTISLPLVNDTDFQKTYGVHASFTYDYDGTGIAITIQLDLGGGWIDAIKWALPDGSFCIPAVTGLHGVNVPANSTLTVKARGFFFGYGGVEASHVVALGLNAIGGTGHFKAYVA